jgi:hypothetical protein
MEPPIDSDSDAGENADRGRLRERLLDQVAPERGRYDAYRREVEAMLSYNEKWLRREKWYSGALWVFLLLMSMSFLYMGSLRIDSPKGAYFGALACFWMLIGAVELLKHFINRSRVEVLKEIKGVELRLLAIEERLGTGAGGPA